jgi:hypothetical protein
MAIIGFQNPFTLAKTIGFRCWPSWLQRHDLDDLFNGADAARECNKGVRPLEHLVLELNMPEAQVRARGFDILNKGRLDAVLDDVYQQFRDANARGVTAMHTAYGWYGHWFMFLRPDNYPSEISDIVLANAARKFDFGRKAFRLMPCATHPAASTLK